MHDYTTALLGGLLLGASSASLLLFNGRIVGISGVLGGALKVRSPDARWRWAFIAGLLIAGAVMMFAMPSGFENTIERSVGASLFAGALVGTGTQLGSGCTSGHGICGIGRLSKRSIVATLVFMTSGAVTVTVVNRLLGGSV